MKRERREHGTGSLLQIRYTDADGTQHKTRTWYMQYFDHGRRVRESCKTEDRHDAQRKLTARLAEIGAGRNIGNNAKGITFEAVRDAWLAQPRKNGKIQRASGLQHISNFFKGWRIADINEHGIERYLKEQRNAGHADPTVRRQLTNLRAILRFANADNRFGLAAVPSFRHLMPNDSKPRRNTVTTSDFNKLLRLLPEKCRPLAMFQFCTGCRTGAALKITWDMVAADYSEIQLPGEIIKNAEDLTLPLAGKGLGTVAAYLRKSFRRAGKPIFAVGEDGAKGNGREAYRYHWNRACAKLDLGKFDEKTRRYSGLRPHDLRRVAITHMIRAGVPRKVAMMISGHKTESVFERYNIVETSDMRRALEKTADSLKLGGVK
jgi:integrase